MTIYLDRAAALNALVDCLLLSLCGRITGAARRRGRLLFAGALGGIYGAASLVPGLSFLGSVLWQGAFGGVLVLLAFGTGPGLLRRWAVLFLLAAAFSGLVLGLTELLAAPAALVGRRVYYPLSWGTLVLTGGTAYGLGSWTLSRLGHQGRALAQVRVTLGDRSLGFTALRDTGNTLREPISGRPVLVADGALLGQLLPGVPDAPGLLRDPAAHLEDLRGRYPLLCPRLIPYHTVGVQRGLLFAIRPEAAEIDGEARDVYLAFSPEPLGDGGSYRALLGGSL